MKLNVPIDLTSITGNSFEIRTMTANVVLLETENVGEVLSLLNQTKDHPISTVAKSDQEK